MSNASWQQPYKDELLSSWLARVALHSGCDPLTLTGAIWPKWRMWTIDADRGLTASRAMHAAAWFGCEPDAVHAATLGGLVDRLAGVSARSRPVVPWITALGNRNRQRYAGLPCCPQCLASDPEPFFRRAWRLAFVVGCEVHGTRLIDRCPYCHALIAPHLCISKLPNLARCSACGRDMRRYVPPLAEVDAMAFQRRAMEVLSVGEGLWDGGAVSGVDWFRRMRGMLAPSRCIVVRADFQEPALRPNNLLLEMQSPREREARLCSFITILRVDAASKSAGAAGLPGAVRASRKAGESPIPVSKELVQADWERWLRRNRRW
ncbi:TniQ family protein [Comamonas antarctica]|uniref:TniQ family protein n=1 Tax=Comamonas antarctica TaxID=2743470 RepID=A0A6N1X5K0_9BURK|nr:TniQ family protein [Comamonas antarctica]